MLDSLHLLAAAAGHAEAYAGPAVFGVLTSTVWVSIAMIALILVMIRIGVPGMIAGMLDSGIADIRRQLDEARALRAEAEALRREYAEKIANAEKDAAAMLAHARSEAEAIVAKAESDAATMIARRERMAEDKIAAAQRGAIADLRAKAADAAAKAARSLIAARHGAAADKTLVDEAISSI